MKQAGAADAKQLYKNQCTVHVHTLLIVVQSIYHLASWLAKMPESTEEYYWPLCHDTIKQQSLCQTVIC